jgi:type IV pilus assembly protein PilA
VTFELDDPNPPSPAWKALLRVNDPTHLQRTLTLLFAAAHVNASQREWNGVTYYTVRIPTPKKILEIGYAFANGYMIIGSSPDVVTEAVELHGTVDSLAKSEKFLASLPPSHPAGPSALLYEDPIAMTALQLRRVAPAMASSLSGSGQQSPMVFCAYGEDAAIRGASTNTAFDAGAVLIGAAIAIPNLLRARIAANEASAIGNIRTVNTAQITYAATFPQRGFAPDLATLGPDPRGPGTESADHFGVIDATLGNSSCTAGTWCTKSGFRFSLTAVCDQRPCRDFVVVATPLTSSTGGRSFCSTADGVVRFKTGPPLASTVSVSQCQTWAPLP